MIVQILPAARADLELAADFYESQCQGLGSDFLTAIISDIDALEIHGGIHRIEYGYHRSVSKRFTFAIYYMVESDVVDIYAVIDCRQDPEKMSDRLG
jgi:plasmid stabilization system protein ParE